MKASKKTFAASSYPQLQAFVRAYLHQDYADEHGSVEGVANDFRKSATAERLAAVRTELQAFLAHADKAPFPQVLAWWTDGLGSAWCPADIKELESLRNALGPAAAK